jgi:hypothetical protein
MADSAEVIQITIDDTDDTVKVDSTNGTVETKQPDGGVVVQLNNRKPKADTDDDKWFTNLADDIDGMPLAVIANDLIEAITADDNSRSNYLAIRARGLDLLGTKLEEPRTVAGDGSAVEGMSTVTNPLLLESVLKGWANAQAELLPASGPVKIKNDGREGHEEDELTEALERDMNHWFTTTAAEYYPDTSHMLLWGPYFGGSGFKKVYRCPMRRRPVSESVDTKDLIVSDTTKSLRSCARITHQIMMRPSVMKRMKFIGAYRDVGLTQPTPTSNAVDAKIASIQGTQTQHDRPEDQPYTVWECQCELDLDQFIPDTVPGPDGNPIKNKFKGEGLSLPYLVTLDKDSREVLAIRRDWEEEDAEAERIRMYVKYPYVPGPGFYGTGLLNILGNASAAMTAAWREALDAGMFASFPGGLMAKLGGRQNSSILRVAPGQFEGIETNGLPISQVVMGMPYRDVTPGLMAMMDKVSTQAKEVGGTADLPAGEGLQNVPVGTMLAQIEQATKLMAAAHKGMHQAQAEELELIVELFREHPEDFWRGNKLRAAKGFWDEQKFLAALDDYNLVPVSDPNVPSHIHRVAKALALVQLTDKQQFAPYLPMKEVLQACLDAIRSDIVLVDPQPQQSAPDPKVITAQAALATANAKTAEAQAKTASIPQENQLQAEKLATERAIHESEVQREEIIHRADLAKMGHEADMDQRQHALDTVKTAADIADSNRQHALEAAKHTHTQNVDSASHALDATQGAREHALGVASHVLDVHQALHPPKQKPAKE